MRRLAIAATALLGLAGCHEPPQDAAAKPYAGREDAKPYAGDLFNGDKAKYEKALATRAQNQNEYLRTGDAKVK